MVPIVSHVHDCPEQLPRSAQPAAVAEVIRSVVSNRPFISSRHPFFGHCGLHRKPCLYPSPRLWTRSCSAPSVVCCAAASLSNGQRPRNRFPVRSLPRQPTWSRVVHNSGRRFSACSRPVDVCLSRNGNCLATRCRQQRDVTWPVFRRGSAALIVIRFSRHIQTLLRDRALCVCARGRWQCSLNTFS